MEPAVETFDGVLTLATPTANVDILPAVASVEIVDNDSKYLIEVACVCVCVCVWCMSKCMYLVSVVCVSVCVCVVGGVCVCVCVYVCVCVLWVVCVCIVCVCVQFATVTHTSMNLGETDI